MDTTKLGDFTNRLDHWTEVFGIEQGIAKYSVAFDPLLEDDVPHLVTVRDMDLILSVGQKFLDSDAEHKDNAAFLLAVTMLSSYLGKLAVTRFVALCRQDKEMSDKYTDAAQRVRDRFALLMQMVVFPLLSEKEVYDKFMEEAAK